MTIFIHTLVHLFSVFGYNAVRPTAVAIIAGTYVII